MLMLMTEPVDSSPTKVGIMSDGTQKLFELYFDSNRVSLRAVPVHERNSAS